MGAVRVDYCPPPHSQSLRLVQVHVFFRHGDRSPSPALGKADGEVWSNRLEQVPELMTSRQYQYQERPFGHLTKKGAEQARELGEWIRRAYLKNLGVTGSDKPKSFLQVRSTNFLRTHMSAWFVLEGLLGSTELAASVPITILDDRLENLYHNDHCPRLAKLWKTAWTRIRKEQLRSDEAGWSARFEDVRTSLVSHLELRESARFPWVMAVDSAYCSLCHGDPLPVDVTEKKLAEIRSYLAQDYASSFQDKEICELSMGRLMKEVVDAMLQVQHSTTSPLMYLYSGHDATIVPLSVALGYPWKDWPAYTASIAIELWSSKDNDENTKDQLFVRVLYDGSEVALPVNSNDIEDVWQSPSAAAAASSKTLHTFEEFLGLAGWTMLSEAQFQNRCQCDFGIEVLSLC